MNTIRLFLLFTLLSVALNCGAQITEYDIEIVIFEDLSGRYLNSEKWPETIKTSSDEGPVNNNQNAVINITGSKQKLLKKYVQKIKWSKNYKVLEYKTWRQAGLKADSAINIPINSTHNEKPRQSDLSALTSMTGEKPVEEKPSSSISGNIKVVLGRYLHLYTDLIYKRANPIFEPAVQTESTATKKVSEFRIRAHRKMRSKEIHYIDHPLVGMLIIAVPVEAAKDEAAVEKIPTSSS